MSQRIKNAIDRLLINTKGEIKSRLAEVVTHAAVDQTATTCHCYCLKVDANNNLRINDLVDLIYEKILEYAIPKKELDEAQAHLNDTGSPAKIVRLHRKAQQLFTDLEKTGEGGEILLYMLVQEFLKIPQLISKMSLKTSGQLHYQGADGIHVDFDSVTDSLNLYWGESKMYANMTDAMGKCMGSLKGFLLDAQSSGSVQERDLQLITSNIASNVNDTDLEDALVRYFDKDDDMSNKIVYKGLCFIGFDVANYPADSIIKTTEVVVKEIQGQINSWHEVLGKKIKAHANLELKEMHVFLLPFPSVSEFRRIFLETIK